MAERTTPVRLVVPEATLRALVERAVSVAKGVHEVLAEAAIEEWAYRADGSRLEPAPEPHGLTVVAWLKIDDRAVRYVRQLRRRDGRLLADAWHAVAQAWLDRQHAVQEAAC